MSTISLYADDLQHSPWHGQMLFSVGDNSTMTNDQSADAVSYTLMSTVLSDVKKRVNKRHTIEVAPTILLVPRQQQGTRGQIHSLIVQPSPHSLSSSSASSSDINSRLCLLPRIQLAMHDVTDELIANALVHSECNVNVVSPDVSSSSIVSFPTNLSADVSTDVFLSPSTSDLPPKAPSAEDTDSDASPPLPPTPPPLAPLAATQSSNSYSFASMNSLDSLIKSLQRYLSREIDEFNYAPVNANTNAAAHSLTSSVKSIDGSLDTRLDEDVCLLLTFYYFTFLFFVVNVYYFICHHFQAKKCTVEATLEDIMAKVEAMRNERSPDSSQATQSTHSSAHEEEEVGALGHFSCWTNTEHSRFVIAEWLPNDDDYDDDKDDVLYAPGRHVVSLHRYLQTKSGRLPTGEAVDIALQIASAMCGLHAATRMMHKNLSSHCILLRADDTGSQVPPTISKWKVTVRKRGELVGTAVWLAPELLSGQSDSIKSDVYAFGGVLYELLASDDYFRIHMIKQALGLGERTSCIDDFLLFHIPHSLGKLLDSCLAYEAENRPDFPRVSQIIICLFRCSVIFTYFLLTRVLCNFK